MMKTQIILLSSFLLAVTTTACSDFLTENPKGRLTPENYFTSQEELDMAVNALYSKVCDTQTNTNPHDDCMARRRHYHQSWQQ